MNYLPKRRKAPRMAHKDETVIRCPQHLAWVRGHECSIAGRLGHDCAGTKIEAAHVRTNTDGGMGMKPSDCWAIPLCHNAHACQHMIGEEHFENRYGISMRSIAEALWNASPSGKKYRATHD